MDKSNQFYLFLFSTTTLFTDINPTGGFPHSWFYAQGYCVGQGLTLERDKSDQLYWTGVYRRLTPWINILGCYPDNTDLLQNVVEKNMTLSSIGMCQEMCFHEKSYTFAVKMNECLCIQSNTKKGHLNRLPASHCNFKCGDNSDDIFSGECGGNSTYNIYEVQGVYFNSTRTCLSLQCSSKDPHFIPKKCSETFAKVCENMTWPDNDYARSWSSSMEQCKISQMSTYLLGHIDLTKPNQVCSPIPHGIEVFWIGVARQIYASIDQAAKPFVSTSTAKNYYTDQLPSTNDTQQIPSTSDNLILKIALPLTLSVIVLSVSAMGAVYCTRRLKATKADRITKTKVESEPEENVDSSIDCVQNNSYFVLEQRPQYISKGSVSSNESPYNNSAEGVYDHLRDNISRKPEVEDTYQHASTAINIDVSEYDTMANAVNKKQEEDDSYDYSHQDTNGNYACHVHAKNNSTDNPYDVAV
uniref:WSC domain-containing protein n=1 Tax=Magallana gigas TaxID=29159 RepID=A0A8W8NY72_MAGGI